MEPLRAIFAPVKFNAAKAILALNPSLLPLIGRHHYLLIKRIRKLNTTRD